MEHFCFIPLKIIYATKVKNTQTTLSTTIYEGFRFKKGKRHFILLPNFHVILLLRHHNNLIKGIGYKLFFNIWHNN